MEIKTLEKMFDYLPVIVSTCDHYGWLGGQGTPIEPSAITDARIFFDLLQAKIQLNNIPDLEEVFGNINGGITFVWDALKSSKKILFDYLEITIYGNGTIDFKGDLQTLGIKTNQSFLLSEGLDDQLLQFLSFFKRQQNAINKV